MARSRILSLPRICAIARTGMLVRAELDRVPTVETRYAVTIKVITGFTWDATRHLIAVDHRRTRPGTDFGETKVSSDAEANATEYLRHFMSFHSQEGWNRDVDNLAFVAMYDGRSGTIPCSHPLLLMEYAFLLGVLGVLADGPSGLESYRGGLRVFLERWSAFVWQQECRLAGALGL